VCICMCIASSDLIQHHGTVAEATHHIIYHLSIIYLSSPIQARALLPLRSRCGFQPLLTKPGKAASAR
jgi:hypothetical protein